MKIFIVGALELLWVLRLTLWVPKHPQRDIKPHPCSEVSFSGNVFAEQLGVKIRLLGGDALIIGGIYRSPSADAALTGHLCNLLVEVNQSMALIDHG